MTTKTKDKTQPTAAEVAAQIANLKDLLRSAEYTERAGLREEISQLENFDYPAAVERDAAAAANQREADIVRIDAELTKLGTEQRPIVERRQHLHNEIDSLIPYIQRRDAGKVGALVDALKEVMEVWKREAANVAQVKTLSDQREEIAKGIN